MFRRFIVIAVTALIFGITLAGTVSVADTDTKQVGIVIAFPEGVVHAEVVTVPVGATSFDVLKAAKVNLASQSTSFGPAICGINGVGCPATNCFCDPTRFWAYYHLNDGVWAAATEGAGSYVPANGAVEGFAWSGFDASYNPTLQPPIYTFDQIAATPQLATLPQTGGGAALLMVGGLLLVGSGLAMRFRQGRR